jgi:hypothetical protein
MFALSSAFDLGLDRTRMKNPDDAARQRATADALVTRLYHSDPRERWELQVLADEVGMGKTFVALAVAYSVLEAMSKGKAPADLDGCYEKVVILCPANGSLLAKWRREVAEFVNRCVLPAYRSDAAHWFKAAPVCERLDEFVTALRKGGKQAPRVVIAPMTVFGGERKLRHYDAKRRFLLRALFRYWGPAFRYDRRDRLLRGAPEGWNGDTALEGWEEDEIPCDEDAAVDALGRIDRPDADGRPSRIARLLETCREISEPYVRDRDELFKRVELELNALYREMLLALLRSPVPLVIVDEAHNWKNGPESGTNGYEDFAKHLAARTRRALLLTATPFQLRPGEMLEILRIGEELQPTGDRSGAEERRRRLRAQREEVLKPVLDRADASSRRFATAWAKLQRDAAPLLSKTWASGELRAARADIDVLSAKKGAIDARALDEVVGTATASIDPGLRAFFAEALRLYGYNADLSDEMGKVVVRHRRNTDHRVVRVGEEYGADNAAELRPDRNVLHAADGMNVSGEAELPHYLLMRCVSELRGAGRRSSLGSALTGCYSTLLESAEGSAVQKWLVDHPDAARHFRLLLDMVNKKHDPAHPKFSSVVDRTLESWRNGEKTLIFCFRTNTAQRLYEVLHDRVSRELDGRRQKCLGGEGALKALRGRITRRDGDLAPLVHDRVLWSFARADAMRGHELAASDADLSLQPGDVLPLARLYARHDVRLDEDTVDRVFLQRAVEHVIAQRVRSQRPRVGLAKAVLDAVAHPAWVEWPYGLPTGIDASAENDDTADEVELRGVHTRYQVRQEDPNPERVRQLAERISMRLERARKSGDVSVFDAPAAGPSVWFAGPPSTVSEVHSGLVAVLHQRLATLTVTEGKLDWPQRLRAVEALRRALLRESVLVRLLPSRRERNEKAWGELLVEALWSPMPGQAESMAHRLEVFLEDLCAASGHHSDAGSARASLLDATKLRDQRYVALVKGGDTKGRERAFAGFNTPLLPEILVCTSVGAEGIDLHRHCRHVVHYDLAWNPAVLEQRTGRVDRIGSKTFRERAMAPPGCGPLLDVGVPFLAGTYDERMYEELRLRSQVFEVLTGGDVTSDDAEGNDSSEGREEGLRNLELPPEMVTDLRVRLHVWAPASQGPPGGTRRAAEELAAAG